MKYQDSWLEEILTKNNQTIGQVEPQKTSRHSVFDIKTIEGKYCITLKGTKVVLAMSVNQKRCRTLFNKLVHGSGFGGSVPPLFFWRPSPIDLDVKFNEEEFWLNNSDE